METPAPDPLWAVHGEAGPPVIGPSGYVKESLRITPAWAIGIRPARRLKEISVFFICRFESINGVGK
jgi:hypothetical protein